MARLRAGRITRAELPEEPKSPYEQHKATASGAGIVGAFVLLIGLVAVYFVWPAGITDVALGAMTLGQLLRIFAAAAIGLLTVGFAGLLWDD